MVRIHLAILQQILVQGGTLISEYDFNEDLRKAQIGEIEIAKGLRNRYNSVLILGDMNDTYTWDFRFHSNKTDRDYSVEVKEDFMSHKTGNTVVEFSCRGKPSGIETTKASHFIYRIRGEEGKPHTHWWLSTKLIRWLIKEERYKDIVIGGDLHSDTKMYLFSIHIFTEYAFKLDI